MAEELGKMIRFNAHLAIKSPQSIIQQQLQQNNGNSQDISASSLLGQVSQIEACVQVVSSEDSSMWTWSYEKFEHRLFMMRELYQSFIDFGPVWKKRHC